MTPDHFETIVDGRRAPLSAAYAHNPLNPKTVTVFLDASPSGRNRTAHAVALAPGGVHRARCLPDGVMRAQYFDGTRLCCIDDHPAPAAGC